MFKPRGHDLSLPDWGPYSKRYAGVSHLTDRVGGFRFDCSVFPTFYRGGMEVPNVNWDSGWHPRDCAAQFEFYRLRHNLPGTDRVFADISYFPATDFDGVLVRTELVNATAQPVTLALHAIASLEFPTGPDREPLRRVVPSSRATDDCVLKSAVDYESVDFAQNQPTDSLVPDGLLRGEIRCHETLDGSALGGRFGRDAGDTVHYAFELATPRAHPLLTLRLRGRGTLLLGGLHDAQLVFNETDFENHSFALRALDAGKHHLSVIIVDPGSGFELALVALQPAAAGPLTFATKNWIPTPDRLEPTFAADASGPGLILKYPDAALHYGLAWRCGDHQVREVLHHELDCFLRHTAHDHIHDTLRGDGRGHFTDLFIRPLPLAARSRHVVWGLVCAGSPESINRALAAFTATGSDRLEALHRRARRRAFAFRPNASGRRLAASQHRMAATTLSNVVFPVYTQRQHIVHRPPGRWWDSLYTWDSGFIGLGLIELDPDQAWENLAQYLTAPGNPHAAFIQHGSMVPMQIHLYHELANRTRDHAALSAHYASIRQYYRFFAGHADGSNLRNLHSSLLRSWDYFYNSGGWDDYPPQKHVHRHGLADRVTPVITTALAIRCARSLILIARALGELDDVAVYEADIASFTAALERHSWDEAAGCYSYVVHDAEGRPCDILRHDSGANFNLGLDGFFPLVAGICPPGRAARMVDQLFDPARFWTPIGLTSVDLTAPYYRSDGYWSGTVWFPHQWFFWKTMLDLDRADLAFAIATRALETWRAEVDASQHCCEHFLVENGRGCGWHQFSGLSTPVLAFFAACHCPGHLTVGFDALVLDARFTDRNRAFEGEILFSTSSTDPAARRAVLVCLRAGPSYQAVCDGIPVAAPELCPGLLALTIPPSGTSRSTQLRIHAI